MLTDEKLAEQIYGAFGHKGAVLRSLISRTNHRVRKGYDGPTHWHEVVSWKNFKGNRLL